MWLNPVLFKGQLCIHLPVDGHLGFYNFSGCYEYWCYEQSFPRFCVEIFHSLVYIPRSGKITLYINVFNSNTYNSSKSYNFIFLNNLRDWLHLNVSNKLLGLYQFFYSTSSLYSLFLSAFFPIS